MALTCKQEYVLSNLDRVEPRVLKIHTPCPRHRYQLDGWDCTQQITSLLVRKKVRRQLTGSLARLAGEEGTA